MSKQEILAELANLRPAERREIFEHIGELEDQDLLRGVEIAAEDKELLDRELADYQGNPQVGSTWKEVRSRIQKSDS